MARAPLDRNRRSARRAASSAPASTRLAGHRSTKGSDCLAFHRRIDDARRLARSHPNSVIDADKRPESGVEPQDPSADQRVDGRRHSLNRLPRHRSLSTYLVKTRQTVGAHRQTQHALLIVRLQKAAGCRIQDDGNPQKRPLDHDCRSILRFKYSDPAPHRHWKTQADTGGHCRNHLPQKPRGAQNREPPVNLLDTVSLK